MRLRRPVQLALLALFAGSLLATTWRSDSMLVDSILLMDPLLALGTVLASKAWYPAAIHGLILLVLTALLGRFFCGWVCPLGTCIDLCDEVQARRWPTRWSRPRPRLTSLRLGLLAAVLLAALVGTNIAWVLDPVTWATRGFTFLLWPIGAEATSQAQGLSRPLLEAAGRFDWAYAVIDGPSFGATGLITVLFFAALLVLSRLQSRFWCRYLCPLGGLLGLASFRPLFGRRVAAGCDASGACARACPTGAIGDRHRRYDPIECIVCGLCEPACEPGITRFGLISRKALQAVDAGRRRAIVGLAAGLGVLLLPRRSRGDLVRPPGALPEPRFDTTCVRCGQCSRACPTHCLQPVLLTIDPGLSMTPVADMAQGHCDPACRACGVVCPTGAIRPLELDERQHAKMGEAVVDEDHCIAVKDGKACLICQEHCPLGAIRWEQRDGERVPVVDGEHCNGCGFCQHLCPVQDPAGIRVETREQIRLERGSYRRAFRARYGGDLFRKDLHPDRHGGGGY